MTPEEVSAERKRILAELHTQSYARAITRGLKIAFPTPTELDPLQAKARRREHHWHPHQLRHNVATRLRKDFGIDVAQMVLGHKTLSVTQVYAEKNVESAQKVMMPFAIRFILAAREDSISLRLVAPSSN